jgi:mRNA interferase YafQ
VARELVILPRFKRDYKRARRNLEFDSETLEYVFDMLIEGEPLPAEFAEHRLKKRAVNWAGFMECHLGADLLMIYRVRRNLVVMHRIGTHGQLFN